ncbi:MAG TPA: hypothetical protein VEL28_04590 [Candidatus Binatia bacterium]|nr:hypothetical protein [Candidatus Binatia bacterium]
MNHRLLVTSLLCAATILPALPAAAGDPVVRPLDLTGTWTGSYSCKGLNFDGTKYKLGFDITARIFTDLEADTAVEVLSEGDGPVMPATKYPRGGDPFGTQGFCGAAIRRDNDPGKGAFTMGIAAPGGPFLVFDPSLPVLGVHFKVAKIFEPGGSEISGMLKGSGPVLPWISPGPGSCKVKLQRIDPAPPVGMNPDLFEACAVNTGV